MLIIWRLAQIYVRISPEFIQILDYPLVYPNIQNNNYNFFFSAVFFSVSTVI